MWPEGQWETSKKTAPDGADKQTHRHTHGHGDSMTYSAQWGQVGEEEKNCFIVFLDNLLMIELVNMVLVFYGSFV